MNGLAVHELELLARLNSEVVHGQRGANKQGGLG